MKRPAIVAGSYLIVALAAMAYELGIRIFDTGNSEMAGFWTAALTMPSSLLALWLCDRFFGILAGDSNVAFVGILGLGAVLNAGILYVIVRGLTASKAT